MAQEKANRSRVVAKIGHFEEIKSVGFDNDSGMVFADIKPGVASMLRSSQIDEIKDMGWYINGVNCSQNWISFIKE